MNLFAASAAVLARQNQLESLQSAFCCVQCGAAIAHPSATEGRSSMANQEDEELTPEELEEREDEVEDLTTALKQAKKKPRYFAIVANGNEVLSLMMQKKPYRPAIVKQERREEGGKQTYQGVCEGGTGSILVFKFEGTAPKFKPGRLRKFISAETGLMVKPEFQQLNAARS
jgi:hypothetical protein